MVNKEGQTHSIRCIVTHQMSRDFNETLPKPNTIVVIYDKLLKNSFQSGKERTVVGQESKSIRNTHPQNIILSPKYCQ